MPSQRKEHYEESFIGVDWGVDRGVDRGAHSNGAEIRSRDFLHCVFKECHLNGTQFLGCRFADCVFEDSDLSLAQLRDASFRNVRFLRCKMVGINWSTASSVQDLEFQECSLNSSVFMNLDLRRLRLLECSARDVDFSSSNLSEAVFAGTQLGKSVFLQNDLTKADFRGARDYFLDVRANKVKKARFSLPEAISLLYGLDVLIED